LNDLRVAGHTRCSRDHENLRAIRRLPAFARSKPAARVDDDAGGIFADDTTDRQEGVVGFDRRRSDNDGIDLRTQPVKVVQRGSAIDIFGFPAKGRNTTVEGLTKLSDDEGPVGWRVSDGREHVRVLLVLVVSCPAFSHRACHCFHLFLH
jgi:hypothetical protein